MADPGAPGDLPVACSLGPDDGPERLRRWRQLADRAKPVAIRDGARLTVRYEPAPGVLEELQALATAEAECCSFVTWSVGEYGTTPVLLVTAANDTPDAVTPIAAMFGIS